jgi:glucokinase
MGGGKRSVVLVGDIGGANTRLAIIDRVKGHFIFSLKKPSQAVKRY